MVLVSFTLIMTDTILFKDIEILNSDYNEKFLRQYLIQDILKCGVKNPIIIGHFISNTKPKFIVGELIFKNKKQTSNKNEWYQVLYGRNRIEACKRLGYEGIPYIEVNTSIDGIREHKRQNAE